MSSVVNWVQLCDSAMSMCKGRESLLGNGGSTLKRLRELRSGGGDYGDRM